VTGMGNRQITEPSEGYLYRVVQRPKGSDDEWTHSNYGTVGRPRTYMTAAAARGQRTRFQADQARRIEYRRELSPGRLEQLARYTDITELEFAVQRAPLLEWKVLPDAT
jgi:hypothetical protein